MRQKLTRAIAVSDSRTMQEDIDFAFRQLVDIGLRALSSAINDPTTAVEATLRVGSLLRRLLVAPLPLVAVAGPEGRTLLRPWGLNANEYIAHGFDQLRQVAPAQPMVAAAILRVLRMLAGHVEEAGRRSIFPRCASEPTCCWTRSPRCRTCIPAIWPGCGRSPPTAPIRPTTAAAAGCTRNAS